MYIQYFLAGFLLADLYVTRKDNSEGVIGWDAIALLAWSFFFAFNVYWDEDVLPLSLLIAFVSTYKGKWLLRLLRIEWIAVLGGMCYSIYLWHFFFLAAVHKLDCASGSFKQLSRHLPVAGFYMLVPAIFVLSAVMFLCFERPFMNPRWPNTLGTEVSRLFSAPLEYVRW